MSNYRYHGPVDLSREPQIEFADFVNSVYRSCLFDGSGVRQASWPNFGRLDLGYIDADLRKQMLLGQLWTRSNFVHLCKVNE